MSPSPVFCATSIEHCDAEVVEAYLSAGWKRRFSRATGSISIDGPFVVDMASPSSAGIWNAEIKGKLCNVQ
jgi:hypothetical protein